MDHTLAGRKYYKIGGHVLNAILKAEINSVERGGG